MTKKTTTLLTGLTIVGALFLGACSSGGSDDNTDPTDGVSVETAAPEVVVDQEIRDQLNVEEGSAIIPGSIESVTQDLSAECAEFVQPLRDLMAQYPSMRQVPPDGTVKAAMDEGKKCEEVNAQEWTDFYTKELAGWMTAKTDG
jgi:hypothetical protein